MFKKKKKTELSFESKDYIMPEYFDSSKLIIANLETVTNETRIPMVETTEQKYIFEKINDNNKERYKEVFTGFIADKQSNFGYFNLPYVVNSVSLKNVVPNVSDKIPKYGLLLLLNEINKKEEKDKAVQKKKKL